MARRVISALCLALLLLNSGCEKSCPCSLEPVVAQKSAPDAPETWIRTELYFGTSKPGGLEVKAAEWQAFVDEEITPAFKEGLTVLDGYGQYLNEKGVIAKEKSKILVVLYPKIAKAEKDTALSRLIAAYKKKFQQESVLKVSQPAAVTFE